RFSEIHQEPALRRGSEIRRSRGTLLEWRSRASQLSFAPALQHDVFAEDSGSHAGDRACGCRSDFVALLTGGQNDNGWSRPSGLHTAALGSGSSAPEVRTLENDSTQNPGFGRRPGSMNANPDCNS